MLKCTNRKIYRPVWIPNHIFPIILFLRLATNFHEIVSFYHALSSSNTFLLDIKLQDIVWECCCDFTYMYSETVIRTAFEQPRLIFAVNYCKPMKTQEYQGHSEITQTTALCVNSIYAFWIWIQLPLNYMRRMCYPKHQSLATINILLNTEDIDICNQLYSNRSINKAVFWPLSQPDPALRKHMMRKHSSASIGVI